MRAAARGLLAATLLAGGAAAGPAEAAPRVPARPATPAVEPRFDLDAGGAGPFPSDRLTVRDPAQRTGLRVALPLPDCRVARSACDDARLLNELDGFDVDPRLAVPFTGAIDPASVTARSVFLIRLAPGPAEATGLERLVYDRDTYTLHGRPEALLEPETRYGLAVTRGVRDASGRPVQPSGTFRRFLGWRGGPPSARAYQQGLVALLAALARRGLTSDDVVVASVFTTGSLTTFLEQAREALDRRPPPPALMTTAPEDEGRAYFRRASLTTLTLRRQVRVLAAPAGGPDAAAPEGAFQEQALPLAAVPPDAVGGIGVGWYWSPWYLTRDRRIVEAPTARLHRGAPVDAPVPFVVALPAGTPPRGGWPLAVFGHGYGGEMFSSVLLIAGTLARQGIATAGITVVGHGGGPEGRLLAGQTDGRTLAARVPGRGTDLNGDGRIDATEGLTPPAAGPLTTLSVRDGLRQQVVDLMAFVRAVRGGLDVDGDGSPDTGAGPIFYAGQSLGGIYGTLFLAVEPRVRVGVLNVPGGPIAEIARLSPVFRPLVRDTLGRRFPSLLNREGDFRDDLPLRGEPAVTTPSAGALAIQEYLARAAWLGRRADPVAYARHLRAAPVGGLEPGRVLVQFATGDRTVPNPTTSALLRAGQLADAATLLRYDRVAPALPPEWTNPHGFLLRTTAPGVVGAVARAAQEQVARFFLADGAAAWSPDGAVPLPAGVFEVPAGSLPDELGFAREHEGS